MIHRLLDFMIHRLIKHFFVHPFLFILIEHYLEKLKHSPEYLLTAAGRRLLVLPVDEVEVEHADPVGTPAEDEEHGDGDGVAGDPGDRELKKGENCENYF